jgi:hypothetical protein
MSTSGHARSQQRSTGEASAGWPCLQDLSLLDQGPDMYIQSCVVELTAIASTATSVCVRGRVASDASGNC